MSKVDRVAPPGRGFVGEDHRERGGQGRQEHWPPWGTKSRLDGLVDRGTKVGHGTGGPNEDKVLGWQRVWGM